MKTFNHKAQDSLSKEIYERVKVDFSDLKTKAIVQTTPSGKLSSSIRVEKSSLCPKEIEKPKVVKREMSSKYLLEPSFFNGIPSA